MNRIFKITTSIICILLLVLLSAVNAFAHSGRTDKYGGHKDNKNASGLGRYHYHCGGYSAHLHESGYCPYTDVFPSDIEISSEKNTLKLGEKLSVSATVYPHDACSKKVTWSSSDSSVATVKNGVITAKNTVLPQLLQKPLMVKQTP